MVFFCSTIGNTLMFTGRMWDDVLGIYDYRNRVYNPDMGVFYQTDPLGYADSTNMYAYCVNDPVNFIDPYGENSIIFIPGATSPGGNIDVGDISLGGFDGTLSTPIDEKCIATLTGLFAKEGEQEEAKEEEAVEPQPDRGNKPGSKKPKPTKKRRAKKKDLKQVEDVAREKGVDPDELGKFIEEEKQYEGRGGADNYSYSKLRELADILKGL